MYKLSLHFRDRILRVVQCTDAPLTIGRDADCDLVIDNLAVSPQQVRIEFDANEPRLVPLDESSPIQLNHTPVTETVSLAHGDRIQIGKHTLAFMRDERESFAASSFDDRPSPAPLAEAWLQFMSGPKLGRTIRLDRQLVRLGKSGKHSAMIASRDGGFYLSHLEGENLTRVNGRAIGDQSVRLSNGETIQVGDIKILFFVDEAEVSAK